MALDNAEFISELSITDPPGTDPLNQGDDHLRTIKKAVQQSFPNVDAAVPQTAAQMAQMAIKNEANSFTQINTFLNRVQIDGQLTEADGLAAAPAYSFTSDPASGMYLEQAGVMGFAGNGVQAFRIAPLNCRFADQMRADLDGTFTRPPYTFNNETNMGMFRVSASVLGWAVSGLQRMSISNQLLGLTNIDQIRNVNGLDATPAYSFTSAPNVGMSVGTAGSLNFQVAGTRRLQITAAGSRFGFRQDGATGGVSLSFENNAGIIGYSIDYEGTAGFQPGQFSISRFNRTTGAFIDIPLYINATTGRVHSKLPILTP